jgi:hypothetical protein
MIIRTEIGSESIQLRYNRKGSNFDGMAEELETKRYYPQHESADRSFLFQRQSHVILQYEQGIKHFILCPSGLLVGAGDNNLKIHSAASQCFVDIQSLPDTLGSQSFTIIGVLGTSINYTKTGQVLKSGFRLLALGKEGSTHRGYDMAYECLTEYSNNWKEKGKVEYRNREPLKARKVNKPQEASNRGRAVGWRRKQLVEFTTESRAAPMEAAATPSSTENAEANPVQGSTAELGANGLDPTDRNTDTLSSSIYNSTRSTPNSHATATQSSTENAEANPVQGSTAELGANGLDPTDRNTDTLSSSTYDSTRSTPNSHATATQSSTAELGFNDLDPTDSTTDTPSSSTHNSPRSSRLGNMRSPPMEQARQRETPSPSPSPSSSTNPFLEPSNEHPLDSAPHDDVPVTLPATPADPTLKLSLLQLGTLFALVKQNQGPAAVEWRNRLKVVQYSDTNLRNVQYECYYAYFDGRLIVGLELLKGIERPPNKNDKLCVFGCQNPTGTGHRWFSSNGYDT